MDNYKFGNYICKLREEYGLTQAELAAQLNISDKAVSKWENGQAFPRTETLEKLASVLNTTVEDIISASKENSLRVCFVNNCFEALHLDVDGKLVSIRYNEKKWVEINKSIFTLKISGDIITEEGFEECQKNTKFFDKILTKASQKAINNFLDMVLQVNCVYEITNIKPDSVVEIEPETVSVSDKTMIMDDFVIAYPKITCDSEKIELLSAKGKNSKAVIKRLKKAGLFTDLGFGFLMMLILYPVRGIYFKHLCKPKVIKSKILKASTYKYAEDRKKKRKPLGCLLPVLGLIGLVIFKVFISPLIFIDSEKPALVAEDYSYITYYGDVYERIEELPKQAEPELLFGATIWEDARLDGASRAKQASDEHKVMLYEDKDGNKYLWLVEYYVDNILTEEKEYEDFTEHYVYILKNDE